jgi:PIN domain nuclease of toxin-antitoxin system
MNRYLLDTHTFLWATFENSTQKLSYLSREVIENPDSELFISSVSIFEIVNKYKKGKLPEYQNIAEHCLETIAEFGAKELSLNFEHANLAGFLEWDHRDPFDRILAAQAQIENLVLITCDEAFANAPGLVTLW